MFEKATALLNKYDADFIFISGDLTSMGLLSEYEMAEKRLTEITGEKIIVPGNHDERNLGFKLFPEFFGKTDFIKSIKNIKIIALASSEPDKDDGHLGRSRHKLIENGLTNNKDLTVIGFHHHVIPIPNSGRETNIIEDAGETLDILLRNNAQLVLMGHRHVPYAVQVHKTLLVNAGTFSCTRTRAHFGNTFNIIDIDGSNITINVVNVEKQKEKKMIQFDFKENTCSNEIYD
jgi:3',5'-cyclic AMP phosphodiesterase CpdA